MRPLVRRCGALAGFVLLTVLGCESADKEAGLSPGAVAPMDVGGRFDSNLQYLLAKYDADGDRRVAPSEYERGRDQFERLDRDGDGFITAGDVERADAQARFVAERALAAHFQADEPHETLTREELVSAFAEYDADADEKIGHGEFEALAAGRRVALPGDEVPMIQRMTPDDPYAVLVAEMDADEDGALSSGELLAFFDAGADDAAITIRNPFGDNNRPDSDQTAAKYVEPTDGAMVGEMAPDFALHPPDDGATVTLSSFRRNLPVALIFGSYT